MVRLLMAFFSVFFIIVFVIPIAIPTSMKTIGMSDEDLDTFMGPAAVLLRWAVSKENIPDRQYDVGTFLEAEFIRGGLLTLDKTKVVTTKGSFVVFGSVSALKGQRVRVSGLSDNRLKNKLIIGSKGYKLHDVPGV